MKSVCAGHSNVPVSNHEMRSQLAQALETLKPCGQVTVHILTSEEPVTGDLKLPGPAAYVKYVPVRTELLAAIESAGFVDLQLSTFRSGACFEHEGIPLRETLIVAKRPAEVSSTMCNVVFKGPFVTVTDDEGNEWRRGESLSIPRSRWESLQKTPVADLFVMLPESASRQSLRRVMKKVTTDRCPSAWNFREFKGRRVPQTTFQSIKRCPPWKTMVFNQKNVQTN